MHGGHRFESCNGPLRGCGVFMGKGCIIIHVGCAGVITANEKKILNMSLHIFADIICCSLVLDYAYFG